MPVYNIICYMVADNLADTYYQNDKTKNTGERKSKKIEKQWDVKSANKKQNISLGDLEIQIVLLEMLDGVVWNVNYRGKLLLFLSP